jgi:uncharacterized membrane protein YjjP (DUF1212 family)
MGRLTRRFRGAVRREAHDLLRGGPPTADLLRPVGPAVPSDAHVQQVLDVCMRVGEVLLGSGEPAEETSDTMLRMAAALGLPTVDVDITFNSITMCCHRGMVAAPLTAMRLVRYRTTDLTRLAAVTRIVARVEREGLDVRAAEAALAEAVAANHPYPRWVATLGWAGQAAAVALLLGGPLVIAATAFAVTAPAGPPARPVRGRAVLPAAGRGMVAAVSTLALFGVGALPAGTQPSLVIAAGITVLLSGLTVGGRRIATTAAAISKAAVSDDRCLPRPESGRRSGPSTRRRQGRRDHVRPAHRCFPAGCRCVPRAGPFRRPRGPRGDRAARSSR